LNNNARALVVSIGTTHPQNVAGLGRDARVAADYGVAHAMVVAAVSAQDERGVRDVFVLPCASVRAQLSAIDFARARAVRIGALGSLEGADVVCDVLEHAGVPIVFDPVCVASAGGSLYRGGAAQGALAVRAVIRRLAPIVTPNIAEAQTLSAIHIGDVESQIAAGSRLLDAGASSALVKGGHAAGDPVDVLVTREHVETFVDSRLPQTMRGTGCTLAMALACELALGRELVTAVEGARAYVRANIARS
jgi:hydroxymethylpyrimidine/phosphomethylpyrimidine kinase